jgi:hypothetical protein
MQCDILQFYIISYYDATDYTVVVYTCSCKYTILTITITITHPNHVSHPCCPSCSPSTERTTARSHRHCQDTRTSHSLIHLRLDRCHLFTLATSHLAPRTQALARRTCLPCHHHSLRGTTRRAHYSHSARRPPSYNHARMGACNLCSSQAHSLAAIVAPHTDCYSTRPSRGLHFSWDAVDVNHSCHFETL